MAWVIASDWWVYGRSIPLLDRTDSSRSSITLGNAPYTASQAGMTRDAVMISDSGGGPVAAAGELCDRLASADPSA
jgi:hypothetical protein